MPNIWFFCAGGNDKYESSLPILLHFVQPFHWHLHSWWKHRIVTNHAVCTLEEVTLKWFCVFNISSSQQLIVPKYLRTGKKPLKKLYWRFLNQWSVSFMVQCMYNIVLPLLVWHKIEAYCQQDNHERVYGCLSVHEQVVCFTGACFG